ncbi:plasmid stabilization system [Agrobacterium albertimagni AOL15]|uniref:Plasmid stabilization system n=1 Tax=Agrobacterium albertimagni AOL15 TaxID=1156935 RepID=K2QAW7_9HYPH|nr:type II toxin-antitoxin system RelE/ParE family toxin [Agrobacterium albertimagni]EKF58181.1 plasmid stabilization system [Agrobacterium albertimagni AOL15]
MSYGLRFAPEALDQLQALEDYIAQASSASRAAAYVNAIVDYCQQLKTFPHRGTVRVDLRAGLRIIGFRRRVTILFEVSDGTVTIIGIYYGGRQYEPRSRGEDQGGDF